MSAYATLSQYRTRLSGDSPTVSGAFDQTVVDIIAAKTDQIDEEVRNVRGQAPGWSFLPSQLYGVQQVSVSGNPTGTFTLTCGATTSAAINVTATAATVQTQIDAILGAGNGVVTGAPGGPWTVTLAGTLTGAQPALIATSTVLPTTAHVVVEELITGSADSVTRRYRGSHTDLLLIDDCTEVSSVQLIKPDGTVLQTLVAGTDYLTEPYNSLPIVGLEMLYGWWSGLVSVAMRPGFGGVPLDVTRAVLAEVTRDLRAAQAGEDDRLGLTPFGTVTVSKALLASTVRTCHAYRFGAAQLRRPS
jgi:hypothetical protein